ncbi:LysE family transporter, partial [Aeromonas jandaei]|uniref:LysE family transporter n=1 Tax=Aeromonas jandaei TaxID=650 RepID=UPI002A762804
ISQTANIQHYLEYFKLFGGLFLSCMGAAELLRVTKKDKQKHQTKTTFHPFLIPVLNPKALLFFASFIPSFINSPDSFDM